MEFLLLPLLTVCLLSCSGTTSAQKGSAVIKVNVGSDAVLPCFRPEQNIERDIFDWKKDGQKEMEVFFYDKGRHYNNGQHGQDEQFKGRVFHFSDQLQFGNASIVIENTIMKDSGNYTCHFPNLNQRFNIQLVVDCNLKDRSEENIPGACPKPSVTSLKATKYFAILKCDVRGAFPKPEVQWQNSAGKKLPAVETLVPKRGGNSDITLQTNVTKADNYHCVVTQLDICHQTSEEISVHVNDSSNGLAADVVATFAITVFGVLVKCYITQN